MVKWKYNVVKLAALVLMIPLMISGVMADVESYASSREDVLRTAEKSVAPDFTSDVIYQIVTDRFFDGNPNNNNPVESRGMYSPDKSNWQLYWGGDFAGIAKKIPYLKAMGVGAIWISPPVKNMNVAIGDAPAKMSGYHGYWGMDFFIPDPHFGSWREFDQMIATAHKAGINVIMDWAMNHTSPEDINDVNYGVNGRLLKNGTLLGSYNDDPLEIFHHNGGVNDYSNRYEMRYRNLFNLADLAQENPETEKYLKDAVDIWLEHGVDGIRMDAVKHMPQGYQKAYVDYLRNHRGVYVFGEWADTPSSPLWKDEVDFANASGQALENFALNSAIQNVFGKGSSIKEINSVFELQQRKFHWVNQQVNFIDGHDVSRLLSIKNDKNALDLATVLNMTAPGIPLIYYGDEQYSHVDKTNFSNQRGGDPYNRQAMPSFSHETNNFKLIHDLSTLRRKNAAMRYGAVQQRWLDDDVFVFERKFFGNVVLIAVNKGSIPKRLSGLQTSLPGGKYKDVLGNKLGGGTLNVLSSRYTDHSTDNYILHGGQAAIWSYTAPKTSNPQVGDISPTLGRSNQIIGVSGVGFGQTPGKIELGSDTCEVISWSDKHVEFRVPRFVRFTGKQPVTIVSADGHESNSISFDVLTSPQSSVTFKVSGIDTHQGDAIYVTGSVPELGNWDVYGARALGQATCAEFQICQSNVSVPSGIPIDYKFFVVAADGSVRWQKDNQHLIVPDTKPHTVLSAWK